MLHGTAIWGMATYVYHNILWYGVVELQVEGMGKALLFLRRLYGTEMSSTSSQLLWGAHKSEDKDILE